jgi:hypothetical protein
VGTPAHAAESTTTVAAVVNPTSELLHCDGRWERFNITTAGTVRHQWQLSVGGSYSAWASLGGKALYGVVAGGVDDSCSAEIFVVGTNHAMFTLYQTTPGMTYVKSWASIGGLLYSAPGATFFGENLGVCATGGDGNVWCNRHTKPYGSPWTGWFRR